MTLPKYEILYCAVCGQPVGRKAGEGAVTGLRCQDPECRYLLPPNPQAERNAFITALLLDRVAAPILATVFGYSRQRIYQIAAAHRQGE